MKKVIIITGVIALAVLAGFTLVNNKEEMEAEAAHAQVKNDRVTVVAAPVMKATLNDRFSATGNFESFREINLSSVGQGKVVSIVVSEGQDVKEGQLIAKLDSDLIEAELMAAEASLSKAKKDLDRFEELAPKGAATPQQLDDIKLAYKNAIARHETLKKQLDNMVIRAPFNGTVNARFVEPGSYVSAGGKIVELVDVNTLTMNALVSESEVLKLRKGQPVSVRANALSDATFSGTISFIGVKADKSLRYPVEIQIKNSADKMLKAGMYGSAEFKFDQSKEALIIPRDAISGSIKDPAVFVVEHGVAVLTPIKIGSIEGNAVEVISGLSEGTQVVTDGQINLMDGRAVTVSDSKLK